MQVQYVNPNTTVTITVPAGQVATVMAPGAAAASIDRLRVFTHAPALWFHETDIADSSVVLGTYAADTQLRINAKGGAAIAYTIGAVSYGAALSVGTGGVVVMTGIVEPDETVGVGFAGTGSLFIDTVAGKLYINSGDATTPAWDLFTSGA